MIFYKSGPHRNSKLQLHKDDGPAVEYITGTKYWYINGKLHRIDGPAVEHADGGKEWYQNGQRHRLDGPAIIWSSEHKDWYINDININNLKNIFITIYYLDFKDLK